MSDLGQKLEHTIVELFNIQYTPGELVEQRKNFISLVVSNGIDISEKETLLNAFCYQYDDTSDLFRDLTRPMIKENAKNAENNYRFLDSDAIEDAAALISQKLMARNLMMEILSIPDAFISDKIKTDFLKRIEHNPTPAS
jgi:hypothetical protein